MNRNEYWIFFKQIILLKYDITDEEFEFTNYDLNKIIELVSQHSEMSVSQSRDYINSLTPNLGNNTIH